MVPKLVLGHVLLLIVESKKWYRCPFLKVIATTTGNFGEYVLGKLSLYHNSLHMYNWTSSIYVYRLSSIDF